MSADAYIIELLECSLKPKLITVVTNDKGLTRLAAHTGAKIEKVSDFIRKLEKKKLKTEVREPKESTHEFERLLKAFEERSKELGF